MEMTYLTSLNRALHRALAEDPTVLVMGEDILDPYGGAFKVTRGLSTAFPDRVLTMPISEALIVGMTAGLAIRGFKPIVEIMFGDFLSLAADQIINHLTKYPGIYDLQVEVPVVLRTPMGGGRGYGATHSQCLERHFFGLPHMTMVSPSAFHDPGEVLLAVLRDSCCLTLFIEHKLLYPVPVGGRSGPWEVRRLDGGSLPSVSVRRDGSGTPEVLLVGYGGVSVLVEEVMIRLEEEEIRAEALFPCVVSPMRLGAVVDRVAEVGRAVVVEEGIEAFGWGNHVIVEIYKRLAGRSSAQIRHVGAEMSIIPSARGLEQGVLPSVERILQAIVQVLE